MAGDKIKTQARQRWFGGGIGAALAAFLGLGLLFLDFGKGLQDWSYDLPFLLRNKAIADVVIIYLDEDSFKDLHQSPNDFDRSLHAKLLNRLKAEGAKLVVFDMLFVDESDPSADQTFATALRTSGNVVIGAALHRDIHLGGENITLVPPLDLFRDAAAGWGLAKIHREADFSARKHFPGTEQIPSLAWKAATLGGAEVTRQPEKRGEPRWLNYYAQEPFRGFSYSKIVTGQLPAGFSFKDKVVFIGSGEVAGFTGEEKEQVRYPWTWRSGHFPVGVEIHALTFANLMRHDWLTRWPASVEAFVIGMVGVLLGYGLSLFRPFAATGVALLVAAVVAGIAFLLSARLNVWFPWMIVVAVQIPVALGWSYLFHSIRAYVETQFLHHSLELYLSPKQVKLILKEPALLKPGALPKNVSILFSDIANFSKISERMDSDDLVKLLISYYETAISCIHKTDGTVVNLIGDAILAIWNAPQDQKDHQERACRAALLLNESLIAFDLNNRSLPLRTRVGLHSGVVCVGNIGSASHFRYTAIGEGVNMASRLEGLNKQLGTDILVTREMLKPVESGLVNRLVGHFRFKGFDQVVQVHELIGELKVEKETKLWRDAFETALHRFQRGAFDEAEGMFRSILELKPGDGPSKFYLDRISELRSSPREPDWAGEIDLREK